MEPERPKPPKSERLLAVLPDVWRLVRPRLPSLLGGFLLMLVGRVAGLVMPASTKFLVDDVVGRGRSELLPALVAAVGFATLLQAVCSFALTQLLSRGAMHLVADLRRNVQAHVGKLPLPYYDSHKTGALVSRIMSDVEGVRNIIGTGLVDLAGGLLTSGLALLVLLWISPAMTAIGVVMVAGATGGIAIFLGRVRPIFRERGKIYAEVTGRLTESLGGVRVVKAYRAEPREAEVFSAGVGRLLANSLRSLTMVSALSLASTTMVGLVGAFVMLVGGRQILAGEMTLGSFLTFTVFMGYLVTPVFQIVSTGTALTEALAGLERTREVMAVRPEDADPARRVDPGEIAGAVAFERVGFAYDTGGPVLHDVSFEAPPGTVTALVGPSGAGKSTIIGLIAGFYTPTSGAVRVDGVDLATVRLEAYRSRLGVVLQESFLFDGTIRENVAFSRPDAPAAALEEACRVARVLDFAQALPQGLDTIVGERGVKLSGGQKQRVSIARALLAEPRILLLDEATSSLDTESESLIQEGLARLMKDRTTFVIAHRLSTVRRADAILVVEGGRIVERGTHAALLAARGRYHELYTKQQGLVDADEEEEPAVAPEEAEELPAPSDVPVRLPGIVLG